MDLNEINKSCETELLTTRCSIYIPRYLGSMISTLTCLSKMTTAPRSAKQSYSYPVDRTKSPGLTTIPFDSMPSTPSSLNAAPT